MLVNRHCPSSAQRTCARGSGWVPQTIEKAGKEGGGLLLQLRRQGAFAQRPTISADYPTSAARTLASGYMQKVPLALVCKALTAIKNKAFWVFRDNAVQHRGSPANAIRWAAAPRRASSFRFLIRRKRRSPGKTSCRSTSSVAKCFGDTRCAVVFAPLHLLFHAPHHF